MEFENAEALSSVHSREPSKEKITPKKVWLPDDFHEHLIDSPEIQLNELPEQIHLDESWHSLIADLRNKTQDDGREWSTSVVSIDKFWKGRLQSLPFDLDHYFRKERWGSIQQPLFITESVRGTPHQTGTPSMGTPSVITWNDKDYQTMTVCGMHTHPPPQDSPCSIGDLCIANTAPGEKSSLIASVSHNYLLIPTAPLPNNIMEAIREQEEKRVHRELSQRVGPPHLLSRLFGTEDKRFTKRYLSELLEYNKEFARGYQIGLYRGEANEPLMRLA